MTKSICVIANRGSGRNTRDAEAIGKAMAALGDQAELRDWTPGTDLGALVDQAIRDGFDTIVAAGGDGTVVAAAAALIGKPARLGVLPLGTFNYFARGLGLPQEPGEAARAILKGRGHRISIGSVNGQIFLNNASVGIYPRILQEREVNYRRLGRHRLTAYWSVVKTFIKFQRPSSLRIEADGNQRALRSPLLFVARSAYQLKEFGLKGEQAISDDKFVVFVAHGHTRGALFRLAWRLIRRRLVEGADVDTFASHDFTVDMRRRHALVAFDGEKRRMKTPLVFTVHHDALEIILPEKAA